MHCSPPLFAAAFGCVCACHCPAPAALVGHWKFDETSGTSAADSSGMTPLNGTLSAGATFQPAAGKFGGAVYLNGSSGQVTVADDARFEFAAAQSFSLACWYKSDGDETTNTGEFANINQGLITKGYHANPYDTAGYYQLQFNCPAAPGTLSYFTFDSRKSSTENSPFRFPGSTNPDVVNNAWHHFAAVLDRGAATPQCRLYVDGNLYATQNFSAAANGGQWNMGVNSSPLVFGNHLNRFTKGWMDDVGAWNHALTPADIAAIFASGIAAAGDVDGDGLPDSWENTHFSNLDQTAAGDWEPDGLTNAAELAAGTNPKIADTDGDGLNDGAEVNTHQTNPLVADTDGDGLTDAAEINLHGTNPKLSDTDGDNWSDGQEVAAGTNPSNPASRPPPAPADLHLNEFVSENLPRANDPTAPADMDGDFPDWIEIRNNEATAVNLIGWQLSDDPANPAKWTFASTTIPAGGYLTVYASGKNRAVNGVQPHTNFTLASRGSVLLSRPDGAGGHVVVSQIGTALLPYPGQKQTVSYGSTDNTKTGTLAHLTVPTPGVANNAASAVTEFVKDTTFTVDRGLYAGPLVVAIHCATPGATIAYTLNGSAPTPSNGTQVPAADGTTPPVATVSISSTTLLRARAWKSGMGMSNIDTQSYIFPANVMTQNAPTPSMGLQPAETLAWGGTGATLADISAFPGLTFWGVNPAMATDPVADNQFRQDDLMVLPTLSLVADWRHLFGPSVSAGDGGIYPPASGVAVEGVDRAASLELISSSADPNAAKGFQVDGNIHVFGGTSQNRWKSYKLSLRFQCSTEVNYRLYGDDGYNRFRNFTLDATMNNTWMHPTDANQRNRSAFVRDFVMADLQNRMGQRGFHSRPVHLYLNGLYWGVYYLHEKPDHHFSAAYYGGDSDDYDVFKHSTHPNFTESDPHVNTLPANPALPVAKPTAANPAGNSTCVNNFEALLDALGTGNIGSNPPVAPDLSVAANYEAVAALLDIDAFIDYMLLNFLAGNQDWADKNLYAARSRLPGGKWRFFSWDAEHVFRTGTENYIASFGNESNPWRNGNPKQIHTRLRTSGEYRLKFADRIRRHMFNNGALTVARMTDAFNDRLDEITEAVRAESARWGHIRASLNGGVPYKKSNWLAERNRLTVSEAGGPSLIENRWNLYMAPGTGQFRQAANGPLYPVTEAPEFSQHGGPVPAGYGLTMTNPNGTGVVYYTLDGADPRSASGALYSAPVLLSASANIKARVYNGASPMSDPANWSALTEAFFAVGTVPASAANLVISEFNYRPSPATAAEELAGFGDGNDFEYIEILNIGPNRVDLTDVEFTNGVLFHFNNGSIRDLAAGGRVLVVENTAAFAQRHGAGRPVAGEFELDSNLRNGGETITLSRNLGGTYETIRTFSYSDSAPWPGGTDGDGHSLVLISPQTAPDHNDPASWRPSALAGNGTPGGTDVAGLSAWMAGHAESDPVEDTDKDGLSAMAEYVLGADPAVPNRLVLPGGGVRPLLVNGLIEDYLTLEVHRAAGTDDVVSRVEISSDLGTWSGAVRLSAEPDGAGGITELWRSQDPVGSEVRCFIRMTFAAP